MNRNILAQSTNRMSIGFFVGAGIILLFAVMLLSWGISQIMNGAATASWSQTTGKVTTSELKISTSTTSNERSVSYNANVVYEYTVNGVAYTSKQVSFGINDASATTAQNIVNKYPVGSTVTVYYAPNDPKQAVLETGTNSGAYVISGIGVIFLIGAGIFVGVALRMRGLPQQVAGGKMRATDSGDAPSTAPGTIPAPKNMLLPLIIGAVFSAIGIGLSFIVGPDLVDSLTSQSWPQTQGKVTSFVIETKENRDSNGNRTTIRTPRITYEYQVNGAKYLGTKITFEDIGSNVGSVPSYATGSTVTVYYSPNDPSRAVLKPGVNWGSIWVPGVAFCFASFGLLSFFGAIIQLLRALIQRMSRATG